VIRQAPRRRHIVMLGEELSQTHDRATRADLRFEAIDQAAHRLNEFAFALSESHLLVLDVIDLVLVRLDKFMVTLREDGERALPFIAIRLLVLSVDLWLDEAVFHVFELGAEACKDTFDSLPLLLEAGGRSEHSQLLLLNFKCELVAHLPQLFLEVNFVADSLLWLVRE